MLGGATMPASNTWAPVSRMRQAARAGVAGNPAVDHFRVNTMIGERGLQLRRKGLAGWQPVPRGKAVAQRQYHRTLRGRGRCGEYEQDKDQRIECRHRGTICLNTFCPVARKRIHAIIRRLSKTIIRNSLPFGHAISRDNP
jgi:hypothetical protein